MIFDNIDLEVTYGLVKVTENQYNEVPLGLNNSLEYINNTLVDKHTNNQQMELMFVKVVDGKVVKLSDSDVKIMSQLFFNKEQMVHELNIDGVCYYVSSLEGSIMNMRNTTYFRVKFEVLSDGGFSNVISETLNISNSTEIIEIINDGLDSVFLDIKLEGSGNAEISNGTQTINLTVDGQCELIGDYAEIVGGYTDDLVNVRDLLKLSLGANTLKIKTVGSFNVTYSYQKLLGMM